MFLKAYSTVARERPELRRVWMPWPRPYVYEHPNGVGRVDLEHRRREEDWTLFGTVTAPETRTLTDIHGCLASLQSDSLESVKPLRSQIALGHYPSVVRRVALWLALNRSGRHRCDRFGTFRLVSAAGAGAVVERDPNGAIGTSTGGGVGTRARTVCSCRGCPSGVVKGFHARTVPPLVTCGCAVSPESLEGGEDIRSA